MAQTVTQAGWDELVGYLTRRLGDVQLAREITQEAYARRAGLGAEVIVLNERAWLFTVARRLVVDHWREKGAQPLHLDADATLRSHVDGDPDPEARLLGREELLVLSRAVDSLPPRTREVFRLHKFEHLSYDETAKRLGMAKNTVMVHMGRALAHCRDALNSHRANI